MPPEDHLYWILLLSASEACKIWRLHHSSLAFSENRKKQSFLLNVYNVMRNLFSHHDRRLLHPTAFGRILWKINVFIYQLQTNILFSVLFHFLFAVELSLLFWNTPVYSACFYSCFCVCHIDSLTRFPNICVFPGMDCFFFFEEFLGTLTDVNLCMRL